MYQGYDFHHGTDHQAGLEWPVYNIMLGGVFDYGYVPYTTIKFLTMQHGTSPSDFAYSSYLHIDRWIVGEPGTIYLQGEQIAVSGETGCPGHPHLHLNFSPGTPDLTLGINPLHVLPYTDYDWPHIPPDSVEINMTGDYVNFIQFDVLTYDHDQGSTIRRDQDFNAIIFHVYDTQTRRWVRDSINFDKKINCLESSPSMSTGSVSIEPFDYQPPPSPGGVRRIQFRWQLYPLFRVANPNLQLGLEARDFDPCPDGWPNPNDCEWGNPDHSPIVGIDESSDDDLRPDEFAIEGISPNPFNNSVNISYSLSGKAAKEVSVKVYDILGRRAAVLKTEIVDPGKYSLRFDGRNNQGERLSNGIYFIKIDWGDRSVTKKITLLK